MNVDDLQHMKTIDAESMIDHINAMPDHIESTWQRAQSLPLPDDLAQVDRIVICGMGGSAIGGELAATVLADQSPVPILSNRNYDLPAFVEGENTLVIASSHSGDTEETLSEFSVARQRGTKLLAITMGGALLEQAQAAGVTMWTFDYDTQPRASLGFSLTLILALLERVGFANGLGAQVTEAVDVMRDQRARFRAETPADANPAKALTGRLLGRIPVIVGAGIMAPVARRWMTQLNENGKTWAQFLAMPELNHNTVVGIDHPDDLAQKIAVVMLRSAHDSARIAQRFDETRNLLKGRAGIAVEEVWGSGQSRLAQMLSALQYGDYVSYYTAIAVGADPTPVEAINMLKAKLGAFAGQSDEG